MEPIMSQVTKDEYNFFLKYDVPSGSDIKPYIKKDKPLVVYRFGNVMYWLL